MHIAIVGAGMAGLAAAHKLKLAGLSPVLFEKSRGVGGRMSTRRLEGMAFDHGAQYFTARGTRFRTEVEHWLSEGHVAHWGAAHFVGAPTMTAPARALAEGQTLSLNQQVSALIRTPEGWRLDTADGPIEAPGNGRFDAVLLAIPAPQVVPLAASAGAHLPGVERVVYAPCIATMLAFAAPVSLQANHISCDDEMIAWIARNSSKLGRPKGRDCIVLHATGAWSNAHLEQAPEVSAQAMAQRFQILTGVSATPTYVSGHRWRYALVETAAGSSCLWDAATGIGACGDWCLGPRVEAAFDSGTALAQVVLEHRRHLHVL